MDTTPEAQIQPTYRRFTVPTLLMTIGGWGGLYLITNYTFPTLWPRWGFFALIVIAITGTAMPLVYFINRTFSNSLRPVTILRESIWAGVFVATLTWLQLGRILNFSLGLWLLVGIVIIEYLMRWRENPTPYAAQPEPMAEPQEPENSDDTP
jgi:hypothetical protein